VREQATRFAFLPLWQPLNGIGRVTLAIASDVPTSPLVRAVTREIHGIQSSALISDIVSVRDQIDATLVSERLLSTLATAFAALALGLAAIGLYGVLSFSVARRRAEFGIRIALGSPPARVAWNVIRGVLLQVGVGIAIGLPAALAAARAAGGLLFGVTPTAADVYIVSAGVLIAIAGVAAWMPAWRACSIDPSAVLRCE
jgi:ABC-type antimicrobial peptide transport system permease subunit